MTCNGLNRQGDTKLHFREQIDRCKAFHDDLRVEICLSVDPNLSLVPNDITSTLPVS